MRTFLAALCLCLFAASACADILTAVPSGGCTPAKLISAATTNATNVKATAGQLYWVYVSNTNASARFVKFYNKATAPTIGTDTPVMVLLVPGNTAGAGAVFPMTMGIQFTLGIGFGTTTGVADADTGAVAANELVVNYCTR